MAEETTRTIGVNRYQEWAVRARLYRMKLGNERRYAYEGFDCVRLIGGGIWAAAVIDSDLCSEVVGRLGAVLERAEDRRPFSVNVISVDETDLEISPAPACSFPSGDGHGGPPKGGAEQRVPTAEDSHHQVLAPTDLSLAAVGFGPVWTSWAVSY